MYQQCHNLMVSKIWTGLLEGWWMFYGTFWALVFGFTLSGIIQAFVTKNKMERVLGNHRPKTIAKASFFGAVSSSCSYAASALAKSLISKGADFTSAMVFMFASTNLVLELGLILWVLIGWQFALAEFVGGAIMIILLTLVIPRLFRNEKSGPRSLRMADEESGKATWADACGYTIGDFTMVRIELLLGFAVAGLATLVPVSFWNKLFLNGHGVFSSIENAVISPIIAFISFVCSVGNVPLGAALWHSGISFGGTIAFIYADLVAAPLVLIYRKYYGTKLALKLTLTFWAIMSISGLLTEAIFNMFNIIPKMNDHAMVMNHFGFNYTTILNSLALIVAILVYAIYKKGTNASSEFAKDLVCGMQVRIADAPAQATHEGKTYYFCMPGCRDEFIKAPKKYL
jgi:uncharacterized membrane protein YraQ (UPF0718 family)/YHS domain-containing protein